MSSGYEDLEFNLASLEGIIQLYAYYGKDIYYGGDKQLKGIYCPTCGDTRRVNLTHIEYPTRHTSVGNQPTLIVPVFIEITQEEMRARFYEAVSQSPILDSLTCVQCRTIFTVLIYEAAEGKAALFIMPNTNAGVSTPQTDPGVAYYLDQAYKAQSVGATSAAVAMYRGALEHLLYSQGYTQGMLGAKISDLKKAIQNKSAPDWAMTLNIDYLDIIQELGNGAIHPNDGNIKLQAELDTALLDTLSITFTHLLYLVYEAPHIQETRLNSLKAKAALFKRQKKTP